MTVAGLEDPGVVSGAGGWAGCGRTGVAKELPAVMVPERPD